MENAPVKRRSLTLSTRLLQKRHSASPQSHGRASAVQIAEELEAPGSPSSTIYVADDVECTPPNKKSLNLDDSVDFSPRLDISLSPNCLFSQTLVTESPEVGWRWNRTSHKVNTTTDSGFDSAELAASRLTDRRRQMSIKGCEDRRNQLDNEQWRAQQMRARELLKERCDKLHRQIEMEAPTPAATAPAPPAPAAAAPAPADAALAAFLNDSETDFFLLEASQQMESKLESSAKDNAKPASTTSTTPTSHHKEKRSSFYMKFLEDESESEDWLATLDMDEAMLEASLPKKPRTSNLQRYKSMPASGEVVPSSTTTRTTSLSSAATSSSMSDTPRIKRHASSHALSLSPATTHARSKLFSSRK